MSYGLLPTGFVRPSKTEILAELREDALDATIGFGPHADLSAASPLGRWLATLAERLDVLWQAVEADYYAHYVPTAGGASLSDKCAELGIARRAATHARAILAVHGDEGTIVPVGDVWQTVDGVLFQVLEATEIPARGVVDVEVEAVEAGVVGNVVARAITTEVNATGGVSSGENEYDPGSTLLVGTHDHEYATLANDGAKNDYQLVSLFSIAHPHHLEELSVLVKNCVAGEPAEYLFSVHLEVVDHTTGEVLGRTETQTFSLADDEEKTLLFSDQGVDVHGAGPSLRIVVVNEETSEDDLGLALDTGDPYQHGAFYANAVEAAGKDAVLSLVSVLPGVASGGDDGETDSALRLRYYLTSATFGSGTAEAILSQVYRVDGVHSVSLRQNRDDEEQNGMAPHSVEVTVYGGDPDDIAQALFLSVPTGCEMLGASAVTVRDSVGQAHVVHFNKAERLAIYGAITLTVSGSFSYDTALAALRDAWVGYVGGQDSAGTFHHGLLPGETVVYSRLVALVMGIPGVVDATVKAGVTVNPTGQTNVVPATYQVAETRGDWIEIEVGA